MKINHVHRMRRKGFSLVELLVVIAIIAGLAAMSYGPIMRQVKAAGQTQAINKGRNIYAALFSFAKDNDGIFPNDDSLESGGSDSNDYLQVLLDRALVDNEEQFWVKENNILAHTETTQPDNDGNLDGGENSWVYVKDLTTSSRTSLPILADSWVSGTNFDTEVWEGKAILVKLDGSAAAAELAYDGGKPLNDDGSGKQVPLQEKRGNSEKDIFTSENLRSGTLTTPSSGS